MPETDTEKFESYLAAVPEPQQQALRDLAERVAAVAPDAERGISYGAPTFKLGGRPLAGFTASKAHLSYLPFSPPVITALEAELDGFGHSKGAIRFTPDQPLPEALVAALVAARRAELEG